MNRNHFAFVAAFILAGMLVGCLGASTASGDVFADENRAELLYGKGVHAYFGGEFQEAVDLLTEVRDLKSEDPRPYYFLALADSRLGNREAADATFKTAARLEVEGRSARDYKISEALRRIQGRERLAVEKYRKEARQNWEKEDQRRQAILFGAEKAKDREIVAKLASPVIATAPFGAVSVNPFGAPVSVEQSVATPVVKAEPEEKKPPAAKVEKTAEKAKPVDDDPFGASKDGDKEEKKAEKKDEMKDDDPFSEPAETKKKEDDKKKDADDDDDDDPFQ